MWTWTFPNCNKNNLRISNSFNSRISNSFNSRKPNVLDQKRSQRPFDRRFQSDKTIVVAISLCPGILLRYMTSTSFQSHILSACAHQTAKCLLLHIRRGTSSHYRRVIWVLASVIGSVFVNSANISANIKSAMLSNREERGPGSSYIEELNVVLLYFFQSPLQRSPYHYHYH